MSYSVHYSNNSKPPITISDKEINITTDLALIGKNVYDYGQPIATNFLHLLENFSNPVGPLSPTEGQLWYKSDEEIFRYFDGLNWNDFKLSTVSPLTLLDTDGSTNHVVTAFYDESDLIAVMSSETFDISIADTHYNDFNDFTGGTNHIQAGITLKEGMVFHGTATSAQYADLAEMYKSDKSYEPGTVIKLGGSEEVTQTSSPFCSNVFGIVSTNPAYLMNSDCPGVAVALEGRVPCKVVGRCNKGDRLVSSDIPGVAMAAEASQVAWYQQVGRALEDKDTDEVELIEVVVGAK